MRKFLDAVALLESVTFHPAVLNITASGEKHVDWPEGTTHKETEDCPGCDGRGDTNCEDCFGAGRFETTRYNLPELRASNHALETILDILGMEFDYAGWIAPERLPELRRHLVRMMNRDTSEYQRDASREQRTIVDKSGDVPRIGKGAVMHTPAITGRMIDGLLHRMIEIIDYCQKHGYGLSWA